MDILSFLQGFGHKKDVPVPIKPGDSCRHKETGKHSVCKTVADKLYYGKDEHGLWEIGPLSKFEKI